MADGFDPKEEPFPEAPPRGGLSSFAVTEGAAIADRSFALNANPQLLRVGREALAEFAARCIQRGINWEAGRTK